MALMRVMEHAGQVLTYDTADVADVKLSTPAGVDGTPARLLLEIEFVPGKRALWVEEKTDEG